MIELRSDTFTLPTPAMLAAMTSAPLGDDVYGEDPTVNRLEALAAERLGKEAAVLMPSGTMANLASLMAHAPRGSSAIVGAESDIYLYEAAGASVCGGIGYLPVRNRPDGTLDLGDLDEVYPDDLDDPQFAVPSVVCLENTHNRCGGVLVPLEHHAVIARWARARGLGVHLDGARVFNAAVGLGVTPAVVAADVDSVQFCLSKGLAAPIGSMVVGSASFIGQVRRIRKLLGGGMRQAGVIAAAGIVALDEMVDRLADDHANARRFADGVSAIEGLVLEASPQTNIVLFSVSDARYTWAALIDAALAEGVALYPFGHGRIRAATHSGIRPGDVDRALEILGKVMA